jgi:RNA polymerase sigma factor (sigma-70 family)
MARPIPPIAQIIGEITAAVCHGTTIGPDLLVQFVATRDQAVFRDLVRIYAPRVWMVCQRCLRDPNDAEDALQATFIVLARKAHRIARPEQLSAWLHGVTVRIAKQIRERAASRRELCGVELENLPAKTRASSSEIHTVLDEELLRLPENLRQAFILCRLEGRTYTEAAQVLGCPMQTVGYRVVRASELLRARLKQRGLAPEGGLPGMVVPSVLAVGISASVLERVVKGALQNSTGSATAAAEAVLAARTSGRALKWLSALVVGTGLLAGAGWGISRLGAQPGEPPSVVPMPTPVVMPAPIRAKMRHDAPIREMWHLKDGKSAVAVDEKGGVRVWELATGRELRRLDGAAPSGKFDVLFHAPTLAIMDYGAPQHLTFWNIETGAVTRENEAMRELLRMVQRPHLAVLDDKVVCTKVGEKVGKRWIFIWNTTTAELVKRVDLGIPARGVLLGSPTRAIAVPPPWQLSPQEQQFFDKYGFVISLENHFPYLIDPLSGKWISTISFGKEASEQRGELVVAAWSANGEAIAATWAPVGNPEVYFMRVLDARTGQVKRKIASAGRAIRAAFDADGKTLSLLLRSNRSVEPASGGPAWLPWREGETMNEQWLEIWDLASNDEGKKPLKLNATAVAFGANGKIYATGDRDGTIRPWDAESHKAAESR